MFRAAGGKANARQERLVTRVAMQWREGRFTDHDPLHDIRVVRIDGAREPLDRLLAIAHGRVGDTNCVRPGRERSLRPVHVHEKASVTSMSRRVRNGSLMAGDISFHIWSALEGSVADHNRELPEETLPFPCVAGWVVRLTCHGRDS